MQRNLEAQVRAVVSDLFSYRRQDWEEMPADEALTGTKGMLSASDMVYLCRGLERHFQVLFTPEALANYGLLTMGDIVKQLEIALEGGYARHGK